MTNDDWPPMIDCRPGLFFTGTDTGVGKTFVTAAETVLHGGPAALVGASGREALRAAGAYSLLETSASQGWQLGVAIERELARRTSLIGASLTLNHPRLTGAVRGYPYDEEALERIAGSPLRRPFGLWTEQSAKTKAPVVVSIPTTSGSPPDRSISSSDQSWLLCASSLARGDQNMCWPPLIAMLAPVTNAASSEAR